MNILKKKVMKMFYVLLINCKHLKGRGKLTFAEQEKIIELREVHKKVRH